jgi:hypothetical protein
MAETTPSNVIVLTRRGRLPLPADFEVDPDGATARLQIEALRIQAETLTCLSQVLRHFVGDCDLDTARLTDLAARAVELQSLLPLAAAVTDRRPSGLAPAPAIPEDVPSS